MKTSFVSTLAMQTALRLHIQQSQAALTKASTEATTGFYADTGLALGARTSNVLDLTNNMNQLQALLDSNGLVDGRLSTAQAALGQMSDDAQTALGALLSASGSGSGTLIDSARNQVKNAFQSFIGSVNLASNGEYLFAGINTSNKPLDDYFAQGSSAKAAFDNAFNTFVNNLPGNPTKSEITVAQMQDFLDSNDFKDLFEGAGWQASWSSASDTPMTSRINTNEVITSSTTANSEGVRKFAMAGVIATELLGGDFSSGVTKLIASTAAKKMGEAITAIDGDRSQLGVAQARVKKANTALKNQTDIINTQIAGLTSVDKTEAITRVNTLMTQIEASYNLTARIQQLSLVNYL
jgi:flagellar hook-associated protein 3 FlgL